MDYYFSQRISGLQPSAIREILKATQDPQVIPFAAGNPDAAAFPVDAVKEISAEIFETEPITALQYGVTEGYTPLKKQLIDFIKERYNIGKEADGLIITSGAQQVMDLATKSLCDLGDTVICECPSFIGSLNCFRSYGCNLAGVPVESDGMDITALENEIKKAHNPRFIYTIPNFQNPSGVTMSLEKRKAIYELAKKYGLLILEDNPYGDLRVSGDDIPSIKSFDEDGIVIYAGSFSKLLAPGIRVGYICAPKEIIAKMTVGKQASDVHTPVFSQMLVSKWMEKYDVDAHIEKIRGIYREKLNLMCDLIDSELGDFVKYVRPEGGLFVWCKLPENVEMLEFVKECIANKVAVVPGTAFMINDEETNCFRMNFSTPSNDKIIEGMKILGKVKNHIG